MTADFGKAIITLADGPLPPSRVLEAFSQPNGRVKLTLRPLTKDTGFLHRYLSKYDVGRLGVIVAGDVLEYTRDLIWRRIDT